MNGDDRTKEEAFHNRMRQAQNGDRQAKEQLISENLGLVYMVLKRFSNRGRDMEELFQIGTIGLMKSIERFDLTRKLAFSTYAVPMIMGEIQRFIRDDGMLHVSRQIKDNARKIAIVREKMEKNGKTEPTLKELQAETGLTVEEITMAMEAACEVDSLSRPIQTKSGREDKPFTIEEQLEDEHHKEDSLVDRIAVRQVLDKLSSQEQNLVELRYMQGMTQSQTARCLGMNQVAVSRMEKKILLYLRRELSGE